MRNVPYPHPGEILQEEFLKPLDISAYQVWKATGISQTAIGLIVAGERSITPETALLLSRFFGMSDQFWIKLQLDYDSAKARKKIGARLAKVQPYEHHAMV